MSAQSPIGKDFPRVSASTNLRALRYSTDTRGHPEGRSRTRTGAQLIIRFTFVGAHHGATNRPHAQGKPLQGSSTAKSYSSKDPPRFSKTELASFLQLLAAS